MDASYQTLPACSQAKPPSAVANRKKAWFGMPELMCTPPLSSEVSTKSSMCAGCGSLPSTGSSYAVPGAFIERRATPLMSGPRMPAPISQSAWSAVCCGEAARCLTREPKTSESDSLRAPDWSRYTRSDSCEVTAWVSSWAITSMALVKLVNRTPSPSPKTICEPSQKALL